MTTHYKDLELSHAELRILKRLRNKRRIPRSIKERPEYRFLFKYYLIEFADREHQYYSLSDKGRFLLRYRTKDRFRFWFPVVLSILALLISIVSLWQSLTPQCSLP